jgi:putative redox protein
MSSERFEFLGRNGQRLAARLDRPSGTPRATALFAHCFTCGKDVLAASRIAAALVGHGLACLRFDFTGLGASEGEFGNEGFSSNIDDLVAAVACLRERECPPTLMIGHSLGGAAVLAAAAQVPEVRAVVTIGAPAEVDHILHQFGASIAGIERDGQAEVQLAGRSFTIARSFVEDARRHRLPERVGQLGRALLVLHAPTDATVSIDNARQIFEAARHPKSFVALPDADHLLSRAEDSRYAAAVIAAWAERYLLPPPEWARLQPIRVRNAMTARQLASAPRGFLAGIRVELPWTPPSVGTC